MQEPKFKDYSYQFPKRWMFGPESQRVNFTRISGSCFENVRRNSDGFSFPIPMAPDDGLTRNGADHGPKYPPMDPTPIEIQMQKIYRSMLLDKNIDGDSFFSRKSSDDLDVPRVSTLFGRKASDQDVPRVTAHFAAGYVSPHFDRCSPPEPEERCTRAVPVFDFRSTSGAHRENGHMEHGHSDQDKAMNLSTSSSLEIPSPISNGDTSENGDTSLQNGQAMKTKRKSKTMLDFPQPPLLLMQQQQGLIPQPMQQLLQQHIPSPQQLQQAMQQQSVFLQQSGHHKLQEQLIQHMNEQLQLNMVQQSQLMQQAATDKNKNSKQIQTQLQQLALQQQQLVQQLQLQQRQYLLSQGLGLPQFGLHQGMTPIELQQLWKEVASHSGGEESSVKTNATNGFTLGGPSLLPTLNGVMDGYMMPGLLGQTSAIQLMKTENSASTQNALYGHGVCKWPGCDTPCDDYAAFMKHMNSEHTLDDRSTAQARVQMQVVSQLEIQLNKERERLQAMMHHLHMKPHNQEQPKQDNHIPSPVIPPKPREPREEPPVSAPSPVNLVKPISSSASQPLLMSSTPSSPAEPSTNSPTHSSNMAGPIRRRVSDKCNLPISTEIQRNRDFYKNTDVRPPFTYASLIRQAIIESPNRQLTLNEIYQWFQTTFAYFRRNEATWKNAVRHNLSLHKCFMRVENVKGAVWTVDEIEFYKRRPQKLSGMQMKSPSMAQNPQLYGESLNASLRAALESGNMSLVNSQNSSMQEEVEDLSLSKFNGSLNTSTENSNDFGEHMALSLKQELTDDDRMLQRSTSQDSTSRHDSENNGAYDKFKEELEDMEEDNQPSCSDDERSLPGSYDQLSPNGYETPTLYNNFSGDDGRPLALTSAS